MVSPQPVVVGIKPWLPPPLSRSEWWTVPVAAERLAAVRIGVGLTLVLDALGTYLPRMADLMGDGSVTPTTAFTHPASIAHRLLLLPIGAAVTWQVILLVWAVAGFLIAAGILTRWAAAVAWFLSGSLVAMNPMLHNAGDQVRTILLFLLIVAPSDATWSWAARRRRAPLSDPQTKVLIYPWSLRLLYVQMAVIYFMNGFFKVLGEEWRTGDALVVLLGNAGWIRWPFVNINLPTFALRLATWFVIAWELGFPALMQYRRLQAPTLWIGVAFHIGTGVVMRVGMFPAYMLCLYLMFVPWEAILPAKRQSLPPT
jgi:hypothetical protein